MLKACLPGVALLLTAHPLAAEDAVSSWKIKPDMSLYMTVAEPSLSKVTHRTLGLGGSIGIVTNLAGTDNPVRLGIGYNRFQGSQFGTIKSSLTNRQFFADIFFKTPVRDLSWFLGASLNRYQVKNEGYETYEEGTEFYYLEGVYIWALSSESVNHCYRGGVRAGLSYQFNRHLAAEFTYQVTELGAKPSGWNTIDENWQIHGSLGNINPAWSQFGVRYTF